jgi:hypothetical protein
MKTETSKIDKTKALHKADVRRSAIFNLTDGDRLKRSDKLWKKLSKELDVLQDNNYTARKLFDYVERHYA